MRRTFRWQTESEAPCGKMASTRIFSVLTSGKQDHQVVRLHLQPKSQTRSYLYQACPKASRRGPSEQSYSYGNVEECRVFSSNAKVRYRNKEEAKWVADVMNDNIPEGLAEPIKVDFNPPPPRIPEKAHPMEGKGKGKGKDKGKDKGKNRYNPYNPIEALQHGMVFKKTKMCTFHEKGMCEKGSNCTYAHGPEELGTPVENDLVIAANTKYQYRQQRAASGGWR